jgi:hypothetical protein
MDFDDREAGFFGALQSVRDFFFRMAAATDQGLFLGGQGGINCNDFTTFSLATKMIFPAFVPGSVVQ